MPEPLLTHTPRKRFGQNFLHDPRIITEILVAVNPKPDEHLVEIGPGTGALTSHLLAHSRFLDLVEIDRDLVAKLKARFAGIGKLSVLCQDVLTVNFLNFAKAGEKIRVIGNLPYNISTPLLFHLLDQAACIEDMHFMLQKEVVDRICAKPGGKAYGRLGIMLQLFFETEKLFEVPPHCFTPQPKIVSALLRLRPRAHPDSATIDLNAWKSLVTKAFSQRRKTLKNALKGFLSAEEIASCGVDPEARPEAIDIEAYVRLSEIFRRHEHAGTQTLNYIESVDS